MTFQPKLPIQTSHVIPLITTVPMRAPAGCGGPEWLIQIISSVPLGCPLVVLD